MEEEGGPEKRRRTGEETEAAIRENMLRRRLRAMEAATEMAKEADPGFARELAELKGRLTKLEEEIEQMRRKEEEEERLLLKTSEPRNN